METKEIEKLCKRCKQSYTDSSNDSSSCRFHPSFFVCRRHDDQKRCSWYLVLEFLFSLVPEIRYFMSIFEVNKLNIFIPNHGSYMENRLEYYELKPEDPPYAAKFYDCCGAEDPNAPGCVTSPHISYDE